MIKERRRHPRLRIPLQAEYLVAGEEEWREGTIWTLGAGGAALLCEQKLARGTVLEGLHFVVEAEGDLPETRIEVSAEVVSIDRKDDFGRFSNFMLGLRFTGLGEQEFELLKQFVFRRLTSPRHKPSATDVDAEPNDRPGMPPIEIRFKLFDEFVEEVSENLSPSGMFIRAHRPLPPGSRFVFQFQLGEDFSIFQGTAEVVWTRRRSADPDRPPGMGVRFLKLDLTSQKMVNRLVGQRGTADSPEGADAAGKPRPAAATDATLKLSEDAEPFALEPQPPAPTGAEAGPETRQAADAAKSGNHEARPGRRLKQLEKRLGKAEAAREKAQERLTVLSDEVDSLREKIGDLESSYNEAESARTGAEAEVARLREELKAREPQGDLEKELRRSRKKLQHRQAQWERREVEIQDQLERQIASEVELRDRIERASETEAELQQRLEQAEGSRKELEQRFELSVGTESELERLRLESAKMRQEWEATEADLKAQLEERNASEVDLQRQVERAGEAEAEVRQRLEQVERKSAELEELLEVAEGTEDELERVRLAAKEAAMEWEATKVGLRAQLEERSASEAELEKRMAEAVSDKRDLSRQLDELGKARSELERRLEQSAGVEAELREQARELRADQAGLEKKLSLATGQMGGIRRLAEEMRSRLNGDLSGHRLVETDLAATLDEVARARSGLDEKIDALAAAHGSLGERLARITEAWSGLEDGVAQITLKAVYDDAAPAPARDVAKEAEPPAEAATVPAIESAKVPAIESAKVPAIESAPPEERETAAAQEKTAKPALHEPEIEDESPAALAEVPEPEPTQSTRLADLARRAVARFGFGRTSASDGNGGDPEPDPRLAPVDEMESETQDGTLGPVAIEETVRAWAAAWSERRVEDYLSFYSREFKPAEAGGDEESGETAHAWLPPLDGMELTLGPISQTEMAPGRFAVQFEQSVESDSYARRTGRTLEMVLEADAWKIAAESFQEL